MKRMWCILFVLILSLFSVTGVSFAEATDDVDILALLEEMPYEQRMVVAEDILKMIAKTNGIGALDSIYQSVKAAYPVQNGSSKSTPEAGERTEEELLALLAEQPLAVIQTEYLVQSDEWKTIYPDMLSAILQNHSDEAIQNAVVAFVAWDKNDLPVKIEGQFDFMGGSYIKEVRYDEINLIPGETFGENKGYSLAEDTTIATFKAIVVSYDPFEGVTWKNPYYEDFRKLYEGKKRVTP